MDNLKANQRAEIKELQVKIQQLKHSVPKGDKKKKKQIMAEIALLQEKMEDKHRSEIEEFNKCNQDQTAVEDEFSSTLKNINISENPDAEGQKRVSKAQKRRDKKEEEERKRKQMLAEAEVDNQNSARTREANMLHKLMSENGLIIKEIAPDGNCLYNAIAHQLPNEKFNWKNLRSMTAQALRASKEQFIPFMTNPDTGEPYTEEEYEKYCNEVDTTIIWGGQVEIQALSSVLGQPVEIFQADSPLVKIGENLSGKTIRLSYHRHAYGLGEHYNSVVPNEL